MPLSRQLAIVSCTLAITALTSCSTEPQGGLDLRVTRVAPYEIAGLLIEYDLTNTGTQDAAVSSCNGALFPRVRVEMPDGTRDSWSGICIAILPMYDITIAPGTSQHRSVLVGQRPGAKYEVTMSYHRMGQSAAELRTMPRSFVWQ